MAGPTFEYIAVVGDKDKAHVKVVSLSGVSTKHGDTKTDRGRLYGSVTKSGLVHTLSLYSDVSKTSDKLVAQGTTSDLQAYFDLAVQNASGITGRAWLENYAADYTGLVVVVSFAVDGDVITQQAYAQALGGPAYDATYGLGYLHAEAQRRLVCGSLPAAVPHLFGGLGVAAFVPQFGGVELPDLRTIASVDLLREAQSELVKAKAAQEQEHLEEMAVIAKAAGERFDGIMKDLKAANAPAEEKAEVFTPGVSTSTWTRG